MTAPAETRTGWMREAALLAAECQLRLSPDAPLAPRSGWPDEPRWRELAGRADGPGTLEDWLLAALAAAERHPDAAAAFSILAEDERLCLPTPSAFARIAVAGLGADYDVALAMALGDSALYRDGVIEMVDHAGWARPRAQLGLRLAASATALAFGAAASSRRGEFEARPPVLASPAAARAAAELLARHGTLWIRAGARRIGRQMALDIAGVHGRGAAFVRPRDGTVATSGGEALQVVDLFDLDHAPALPQAGGAPFVVIAPVRMDHPGFRAIDAPALSPETAERLWQTVPLPPADRAALARRFRLTLPELRAAGAEAEMMAALAAPTNGRPSPPPTAAAMARAIRAEGARRMGPAVALVESGVTLDDLVATPTMRAQLDDAVAWHRHSDRVWGIMGMDRDAADARGLSLLFSGPPGGGKTFAARCLTNALELNLYRIDLSQVVSKYIGETEKALARVFDEAEAGHGMLFFDEADAIFGKRSEVKEAHDRYANIEVGYLLQRMESFSGVMVLATNLRANLDPAFLRRIRFVIDFPMPGRAERRALWERNLPSTRWRDAGLDLDMLSERFRLSGGNIRNAGLAAAHLAAAEGAAVGPAHLARAVYRELEKSGLPRGNKDLGPLAGYLEAAS